MSWWKESKESAAHVSTPAMMGEAANNSEKARQMSELLHILHFDKQSFSIHYNHDPDDATKVASNLANLSLSEQGMATHVNEQNNGPSALNSKREWIDWDFFLDRLDALCSTITEDDFQDTNLADFVDSDGGALIHYVCASGPPIDIIKKVLKATTKLSLFIYRYGIYTKATPLHLACASGCSAIVFEEILHYIQAESPQLLQKALTMQDGAGRTPLFLTCQGGHPNNVESPAIVQLLLDADETGESLGILDEKRRTPIEVSMKYASEGIIQRLLKAGQQRVAQDVDEDISPPLPSSSLSLHNALRNKSRFQTVGRVAMLLADREQRELRLNERNNRGQLPIHIAIAQTGHVPDRHDDCGDEEILRLLIENDVKGNTFTTPDNQGQTPLDVILTRIKSGDHTVVHALNCLILADERRCLFGSLLNGMKNAVEHSPTKSNNSDHNELQTETMLDHLLAFLPSDPQRVSEFQRRCLALIVQATPPGLGLYDTSLYETKTLLGWYRWDDLLARKNFHDTMNLQMGKRSFTVQFTMDLCMRALLLVMYSIASNRAVDDSDDGQKWPFVLTYGPAIILLIWQARLIWRQQLYYFLDFWNPIDLTTQILIVVSSALLGQGLENEGIFRSFNVLVGGLAWFVILIAALRSTFLHFSVFVSGLLTILRYMIPFGLTTMMMLGAFAEMYFKANEGRSTCDTDPLISEFCVYGHSFLKMYSMFIGGVDGELLTPETDRHLLWLSVMFSFLFGIVMLNVLVAVIFDAWGRVSPRGAIIFWRYRHQFLTEATGNSKLANKILERRGRNALLRFLELTDKHVCDVVARFHSRPVKAGRADTILESWKQACLYITEGLYLGLWFSLGFVTVGLLWAEPFRIALLVSPSRRRDEEEFSSQSENDNEKKIRQGLVETRVELQDTRAQLAATQEQLKVLTEAVLDIKRSLSMANSGEQG